MFDMQQVYSTKKKTGSGHDHINLKYDLNRELMNNIENSLPILCLCDQTLKKISHKVVPTTCKL